jgi:hypothetical protein
MALAMSVASSDEGAEEAEVVVASVEEMRVASAAELAVAEEAMQGVGLHTAPPKGNTGSAWAVLKRVLCPPL